MIRSQRMISGLCYAAACATVGCGAPADSASPPPGAGAFGNATQAPAAGGAAAATGAGGVGAGGNVGAGGSVGTGGATSNGGVTGSGSNVGAGGVIGSGGIAGSGGVAGSGGIAGSGGPGPGGVAGSGSGGVLGAGGTTSTGGGPTADKLPTVNGACPSLATGAASVLGTAVQLWVGTKPGPAYFYWHATGMQYTEVDQGLPGATAGVATNGGFVASFATTNSQGVNTGNGVWYTGDFNSADQILACAIQKGIVDTSRIYTAGYSAGGLQACAMVAQRGKYLAAAICYSGGAAVISGTPQDTTDLPATLLLHGAAGKDTFILDFNQASQTWATAYVKAGGFAINCDDGGDHITSAVTRMGFGGRAMPFLAAHTYDNSPEPYAGGLPSGWPSYCQIVK